ncbi:MAG: PilC/PilY family type IV pilus protein, partial [Steroidobacteraceae bacterium]|nr:PilC/PilY family type IV pilus protein [Steroidobacteraceae bacterium]MDW8258048.1 PilC/PilY family type IV pilus protein [Gammaproteobacteria bacterium]
FLVTNALTLRQQLGKAFDEVQRRAGSAAVAAVNAGTISDDTRVYQATFSAADWSGNLYARRINANGTFGAQDWDAATRLPSHTARKIATVNSNGTAVPFRWTDLDSTRQGQIRGPDSVTVGQQRLNYLRGDRSLELRNGGYFRNRNPISPLGDMINSAPVFVAKPAFRYPDNLESVAYSSFRDANANRAAMIYIGGNDGMLHAFDAVTGEEKWAFIPGQAFNNLRLLSEPTYTHKYFVDGSPTMADAFWMGQWRTVLVTGLGQGGQGVFTLDITNPNAATEASVASKYMWSFTDANDSDMGFALSRPSVVRAANGDWVAIFGNGYNNTAPDGNVSSTGNAVLYIVRLRDGQLLRKIDTEVGYADDPTGQARPN